MHTPESYKTARQKPALVYWVHYLEHTNPHEEGYVGITTSLTKRLTTHLNKNPHVGNRMRAGAVVTILHEVDTLQEAAAIEEQYRPNENIGWNINKGGDVPPNHAGKRLGGKNILVGTERTDKQQEASLQHSIRMQGRDPWNKGKHTGQVPWNKGKENKLLKEIANTPRSCPHCGKHGKGSSMLRWHFDNCRNKHGRHSN